MKKALLLCSSHNDLGLIKSLRKLGYYIVVIGNQENLIGQKLCDKYIKMDYSNKEEVLELALQEEIDAIVQCCNDFGVYTASYVAEKMGLQGYDSYEKTLILHNKDKFKKFAKENNIMSPKAESYGDYDSANSFLSKAQYPLIVKPIDCSAGNGVSKIECCDQAPEALKLALESSKSKRIVIEPFIEGSQHGLCTFLVNKKVVSYCTNDEYSFLNPYRVEIDTFPATDWEKATPVLIKEIEKIANILELKDGIFHLQYIWDGERPWILEVMRRILGNMYSVPAMELTCFDWDYWETRVRCGLSCDGITYNTKQEGCFAYKTILAKKNGTISDIIVPEELKRYIYKDIYLLGGGDKVEHYEKTPVGFLFLMFSDEEIMHKVLIDDYKQYEDMVKMYE